MISKLFSLIVLIFLTSTTATIIIENSSGCQKDWEPAGSYCIRTFKRTRNYRTALRTCERKLSKIFDISGWDDCELNQLLAYLYKIHPNEQYFWVCIP
jgi:hypothetical protein